VGKLLARGDAELSSASEAFDFPLPPRQPATFNLLTCSACGKPVAENKARLLDGKPVCLPCSDYGD
jgi:formylmethanofuran dehydrogenase subunit E